MPLQIFCTISFSSSKEKHTIKSPAERNLDKSLYGQHNPEDSEKDSKEEEELGEKNEETAPNLAAFASSCTLHGANHIFRGNGFGVRQILWAGVFLISLSIFLSQVAGRIFYYLEYHHITQLDEQESPQLTFPAITFCNINRIRVSQLTYDYLSYISPLWGYDVGTYLEAGFPLATPSLEVPEEPLNLLNFYDRSSHQLEDMMLTCRYRGEICRPEDFTMVSDGFCSFSDGKKS